MFGVAYVVVASSLLLCICRCVFVVVFWGDVLKKTFLCVFSCCEFVLKCLVWFPYCSDFYCVFFFKVVCVCCPVLLALYRFVVFCCSCLFGCCFCFKSL